MKILVSKIKNTIQILIFNIHTILLIAGMVLIAVSAFLVDLKIGLLISGAELIILALLISWNLGKGGE